MNELNVANRTLFTRDNLDILRGLNSESVDLIYLDPPFNSNKTYSAPIGSDAAGASFKDAWTLNDIDEAWIGQIAELYPAVESAINTAGLSGSKGDKAYLIFMAVRLLEMHRILKDTGSVYLHCDPTMSHFLKIIMDCIFGKASFRNEIIWERMLGNKTSVNAFPRNHDVLLYYGKTDEAEFEVQYKPLSKGGLAPYKYKDKDGRWFQLGDVSNPHGNGYEYSLGMGEKKPFGGYRMPEATAREWLAAGTLMVKKGNVPRKIRYLDDSPGAQIGTVWSNLKSVGTSDENVGYPTQKPLALLQRIIKASSNPGDVVLDPFCGCATACVAAEILGRKWIGIDISPAAKNLVKSRLENAQDMITTQGAWKVVSMREDLVERTDNHDLTVKPEEYRHVLYGKQDRKCAGCGIEFLFRNLTIDHIIPQIDGGEDTSANLQLLCGWCNSIKGNRPMSSLLARLKELKIIS